MISLRVDWMSGHLFIDGRNDLKLADGVRGRNKRTENGRLTPVWMKFLLLCSQDMADFLSQDVYSW